MYTYIHPKKYYLCMNLYIPRCKSIDTSWDNKSTSKQDHNERQAYLSITKHNEIYSLLLGLPAATNFGAIFVLPFSSGK